MLLHEIDSSWVQTLEEYSEALGRKAEVAACRPNSQLPDAKGLAVIPVDPCWYPG